MSFSGDLRWLVQFGSFLEKASWISVSQIKSPAGRVFQKYVYNSLIVKMRVNLGSFGLFWFNWVGDNAWGRNSWSSNFRVYEVRKFKFRSVENMGFWCSNGSISLKVQIFCEGNILMKCSILCGGLRGSIWLLIFENFYMVFRWGQGQGWNLFSCVQNGCLGKSWVHLCTIMHKIIRFFFCEFH